LAVQLHLGVARRAGRLLVGREERVLQGAQEDVAVDALLLLEHGDGLDDLLRHQRSSTRWLLRTSPNGIWTSAGAPSTASEMPVSSAPRSTPVKVRRPSTGSCVLTATVRPT